MSKLDTMTDKDIGDLPYVVVYYERRMQALEILVKKWRAKAEFLDKDYDPGWTHANKSEAVIFTHCAAELEEVISYESK